MKSTAIATGAFGVTDSKTVQIIDDTAGAAFASAAGESDNILQHRTQKWIPLLGLIRCFFLELAHRSVRKTGSTFPHDALAGTRGDDVMIGGLGNDSLYGDTGADSLYGADGNDLLRGWKGNDLLDGGAGNDTMRGGEGDDTVQGSAGSATAIWLR